MQLCKEGEIEEGTKWKNLQCMFKPANRCNALQEENEIHLQSKSVMWNRIETEKDEKRNESSVKDYIDDTRRQINNISMYDLDKCVKQVKEDKEVKNTGGHERGDKKEVDWKEDDSLEWAEEEERIFW